MVLDGSIKLFLRATGDVNFGTIGDKSLADHETNARATTSDEGDDMTDVKEDIAGEVVEVSVASYGSFISCTLLLSAR